MDPVFQIEVKSSGQLLTVQDWVSKVDLVKFFARVEVDADTGCWIWTGSRNLSEYGLFSSEGFEYKAHRFIYQVFHGKIDVVLQVHHVCANKPCVNPLHLQALTTRQHSRVTHGYAIDYTTENQCVHGHELVGDNVYVAPKTSKKRCRACKTEWSKASLEAIRLARPKAEEVAGLCEKGHSGKLPGHPCKECHRINSAAYYRRIRDAANEERLRTGTMPVGSKFKTECKNKHSLLDPGNILPTKNGQRRCRQCALDAMKNRWELNGAQMAERKRQAYAAKKAALEGIRGLGDSKMLDAWLERRSAAMVASSETGDHAFAFYVVNGWPVITWRNSQNGRWNVFKPIRPDTIGDGNFAELIVRATKYVSAEFGPMTAAKTGGQS